jgi:hypothetical protein
MVVARAVDEAKKCDSRNTINKKGEEKFKRNTKILTKDDGLDKNKIYDGR